MKNNLKSDRLLIALDRHGIRTNKKRPTVQEFYEMVCRAMGKTPDVVTVMESMWTFCDRWLEQAEGRVVPHKPRKFKAYVMPTATMEAFERSRETRTYRSLV